LSIIAACAGRGEFGRLLFWGRGGGSICVDVLLDAVNDGGRGAAGVGACGLDTPCGDLGTEFISGILESSARDVQALGERRILVTVFLNFQGIRW
jgi:hypothetical protein